MSAVRFLFAAVFLLIAALVFLPAPALAIWQWKLAAIEYGQWLALGPLVVIVLGRRRSVLDSISVGMAVIAIILFLSSGVRATLYEGTARSRMNAAFPAPSGFKNNDPFSFFRLWSTAKPAAVEVQTVEFAQHETTRLQIDFYPAQGRSPAPCVVVLHGGMWNEGGRGELPAFNHFLARKGYAVAAVDYRLSPQAQWPAQRDDALAAVSYLQARAADFGIDPSRFVLFGRAGGGQLAEAVAAPGENPGIVGCIAFYAPTDLKFAIEHAKRTPLADKGKLVTQYLGGTPAEAAEAYEAASPYLLANPKTPPTLLLHGENDELVWSLQSQRYSDRLHSDGVRTVFLKLPWATHRFDQNFNGPGGQFAAWAVERFLAAVTAGAE